MLLIHCSNEPINVVNGKSVLTTKGSDSSFIFRKKIGKNSAKKWQKLAKL